MFRDRWLIGLITASFLASIVIAGAAMRQTVFASPSLQQVTDTPTSAAAATETFTTTETLTPTETFTTTETITPTEIVTPTETITPTETVTPTETAIPTISPTATPGVQGLFWSYAAKFACGDVASSAAISGTASLQPGSYSTAINIHNPHYQGSTSLFKKVVLLTNGGQPVGRAPSTAQPSALASAGQLGDDGATMEDCASIWALVNPNTALPSPMPLMTGYIVILSPRTLDVDTVMTASSGQGATGVALDTTTVQGKHVLILPSALPGGVMPSAEEFSSDQ